MAAIKLKDILSKIREEPNSFVQVFPDAKEDILAYAHNANCACKTRLINFIKKNQDGLKDIYSKDVEIIVPKDVSMTSIEIEPINGNYKTAVDKMLAELKESNNRFRFVNCVVLPNKNLLYTFF